MDTLLATLQISDFLQAISGAMVPLLVGFGVYLGYQHWRLAQQRLQLDLFDRRYIIYVAARKLLSSIFTTGRVSRDELQAFDFATRESRWLFDSKLEIYLSESLARKASELQGLEFELEGVNNESDRDRIRDQQQRLRKWFADQNAVMDERFSKYMRIHAI